MNSDLDTTLSYGKLLRSRRINRGMSLEDVFRKTKVRPNILNLIENEKVNELPSELFTKSFLKAYAEALDFDSQKIIALYQSELNNTSKNETQRGHWTIIRPPYWLCIIIVILCLITGYWLMLQNNSDPLPKNVNTMINKNHIDHKNNLSNASSINQSIQKQLIDNSNKQENVPIGKKESIVSEKLSLIIKAVDKTWMKITVDEQSPREFMLRPGDSLKMEASKKFEILLGNAKGVQLKLNEKSIEIPEDMGRVVTLTLP